MELGAIRRLVWPKDSAWRRGRRFRRFGPMRPIQDAFDQDWVLTTE
jgi:hypothetical protein